MMRFQVLVTVAMISGMAAHASKIEHEAQSTVTICMGGDANFAVLAEAKAIASQIFAGIGVGIEWRGARPNCPAQAVQISLTSRTPSTLKPGALAFAKPYQGLYIRVFYDRIAEIHNRDLIPHVLAHVLAHEITHILEGICRHSDRGIMKARWDDDDFSRMGYKPLSFADEDVALIRAGLAARAGNAAGVAGHPQP